MLTQYAFSILFIDKKKAKFSNDRFGLKSQSPAFQKKARTVGITKKELDDSIRSDESKTTQCT